MDFLFCSTVSDTFANLCLLSFSLLTLALHAYCINIRFCTTDKHILVQQRKDKHFPIRMAHDIARVQLSIRVHSKISTSVQDRYCALHTLFRHQRLVSVLILKYLEKSFLGLNVHDMINLCHYCSRVAELSLGLRRAILLHPRHIYCDLHSIIEIFNIPSLET